MVVSLAGGDEGPENIREVTPNAACSGPGVMVELDGGAK